MFRIALLFVAIGTFLAFTGKPGIISAEEKKEPPKEEKKDPPKKEEKILGKTVGEWIEILRTHENPKWRRGALIALEAANEARSTGLAAVLAATDPEKEKDVTVRRDAIALVGRLGPKTNGTLKALVASLQTDKDDAVRQAAATAIGADKDFTEQVSDSAYIVAIIDGLKDPHPGTRVAVAGVLRNMGPRAEAAFGTLLEAAKDSKEHILVRGAAIHVLSRHADKDPKTVSLLIDLLKNAETQAGLREAAAEGLGRTGADSAEAVTLLSETLKDKGLELRKAAAVSLGVIGAKAKDAWPTVRDRLYTKEKDDKYVAVEPDSGVRGHLIRLSGTLAKSNNDAIPILIEVAQRDKSNENRIAAIQELGELGRLANSAIPALETISKEDARAPIREAAEKAVKRIKLD